MPEERLLSKTISFLRFPLIVGVALIHSRFQNVVIQGAKQVEAADYRIFASVVYLFSETFGRVAVPLFFFFSGFLFFRTIKDGHFTAGVYLSKLKRRARTLLVPYVFWNLLMIVFMLFCQTLVPTLTSGRCKLVADYSVGDWLWDFWNTHMVNDFGRAYPINAPLWYLRDLMVIMILSPLVYCVARWLKLYGVMLLGIAWLLGINSGIIGFNTSTFFFFTSGAYFGIHGKNFVTLLRPCMVPVTIIYLILVVLDLCFFGSGSWWHYIFLHKANYLLGMVVAITVSSYFLEKGTWKVSPFLSSGYFFVYVCHIMPLICFTKLAFKLVQPHSDISLLMLYILCPLLAILVCLALYWGLRKFLPRFTAVIMGGR